MVKELLEVPSDLKNVVSYDYGMSYLPVRDKHSIYQYPISGLNGQAGFVKEGDRIYELGFLGVDGLTRLSRAVGKTGRVIGIEPNKDSVLFAEKYLTENGYENVEVYFADGRDIGNEEYGLGDGVVCANVLQFLDKNDSSKVLDEIANICKDKGNVFLCVEAQELYSKLFSTRGATYNPRLRKLANDGLVLHGSGNKSFLGRLYTKEEISKEMESRGFEASVYSITPLDADIGVALQIPNKLKRLPLKHFVFAKKIA